MCASYRTDRRWTAGHRRRADAATPRNRRSECQAAEAVAGAAATSSRSFQANDSVGDGLPPSREALRRTAVALAETGQAVPTKRIAEFRLKPARPHPETFAPDATRRNRLELAVAPF